MLESQAAVSLEENNPYIVRGAHILCSYGSHIRRLDMPVCHGAYIRALPMMHERDCRVGLSANIPPFGACFSPENHGAEIMIHDSEDIVPYRDENGNWATPHMPIVGRLCAPVFGDGKWCNAHESTLVDGVPALRLDCTITCIYRGTVFFIDDGQGVG